MIEKQGSTEASSPPFHTSWATSCINWRMKFV